MALEQTQADPPLTRATEQPPAETPFTFRRWLVALLIGLAGIALTALAIRHIELVVGRYLGGGVPPIPSFAVVILLVALTPLLRRIHPSLALDRRQLLLIYMVMAVGVVLNGAYIMRAFLPHLTSLRYWQDQHESLQQFVGHVPDWYAPTDTEALQRYFQGSYRVGERSGVPWNLWLLPLLRWSFFFLAFFVASYSMLILFRRQWIHNERLSYPLLFLPLSITDEGRGSMGSIFRRPIFWLGVGLAATFNGFNIGHALNPVIPHPGFYFSFRDKFPNAPLTPLNSVMCFFMLESIGFGYLLPLEISFSAWFFYVLQKAAAVFALLQGHDAPGFPYIQEQSAGAYVGVMILLIYGARRHLAGVFSRALGLVAGGDPHENREERAAVFAFAGSIGFLVLWWWVSGFSLLVAGPFLAMILCFTLVYARLRAETGVPFEFMYPYGLPHGMLINWFSVQGVVDTGGVRSLTMLSQNSWLSRHHYTMAMGAYQADSFKLSEQGRIPRKWIYSALGIALLFGFGCAAWSHLTTYYDIGSSFSGGTRGEYRARVALQEYQQLAANVASRPLRDIPRLAANGVGAGIVLLLGAIRTRAVQMPLHPLGFLLATAYGDHSTSFFPMLVAWSCKATVLKLGGLQLYRTFIPMFLGLIVGHMLIGGVFWPAFSLLLAPEASQSYHLYFGG